MAKKTVISDFGALKGKVTFSDRASASTHESEKKQEQQKSVADNVLKIGQKVVLIDSDLRGRIVSLGKTAGIELEDGLVIQVHYGEFAVTDEDRISALKQSRVKSGKTSPSKRKGQSSPSGGILSVDLHIEAIPGGCNIPAGQQLQFQMDTFRRIIRENLPHRGMKICFIHGVGDGILKAAIRKELDEVLALRCSYSVGDPAVTVVSIK